MSDTKSKDALEWTTEKVNEFMDKNPERYPMARRAEDLSRVTSSAWFAEAVAVVDRRTGLENLAQALLRTPSPWRLVRPNHDDN